MLHQLYF